jgi:phage terminase large subunit GpA-like protein
LYPRSEILPALQKSSNVSSTPPVFGTTAISFSIRATERRTRHVDLDTLGTAARLAMNVKPSSPYSRIGLAAEAAQLDHGQREFEPMLLRP